MLIPVGTHDLARRLSQLFLGLVLFGLGIGLMLQSGLGVPPWDVLHQGLAVRFGLSVGAWSVIVSLIILLIWIPLRQPYGIGTLCNAVIIGLMIDATSYLVPPAGAGWVAWAMLLGGVSLIGVASGLYLGTRLGPGARDGLMTAISRRGPSIRLTRVVIESSVLVIGWLMGGTFGAGTVVFALAIGPLVQFFLPRWQIDGAYPAS
jgi:uncharacterized membrane protein YczE